MQAGLQCCDDVRPVKHSNKHIWHYGQNGRRCSAVMWLCISSEVFTGLFAGTHSALLLHLHVLYYLQAPANKWGIAVAIMFGDDTYIHYPKERWLHAQQHTFLWVLY